MPFNCDVLTDITRDCSSAIGGIQPILYINDSENVDWSTLVLDPADNQTIQNLSLTGPGVVPFKHIEFRQNLGSLTEEYTLADDGAVVFTFTLTLPIHGRDANKSRAIATMAAGQRELDLIVLQNDGGIVYLRQARLATTADGTGLLKTDGSKYTLTFTGVAEHYAYFLNPVLLTPGQLLP